MEDNILGRYRSVFNHYDVIGLFSLSSWRNKDVYKAIEFGEKRKIRAITLLKVIQGHRGRYQSKARMRLPISD